MRILLTGANGFIGKYLTAELLRQGLDVVPAVRDPTAMDRVLGKPGSIQVDFNSDTSTDVWLPRLSGIDAVINCVGILQGQRGQSINAIHVDAPRALFDACKIIGVRRIIQISAVSASREADTAYATTKASADEYLRHLDLDWTIFKPSLVVAPSAFGGTALLRALSALPFVTPVVGSGTQEFRPVDMTDLCKHVAQAISDESTFRRSLLVVGPEVIEMGRILTDLRRWLGYRPAKTVHIPVAFAAACSRLGDLFGGTINTTALRQLQFGNAARRVEAPDELLVTQTGWREILRTYPAQAQDRWHARLYTLRPILRFAVGLTWLVSGLVAFLQPTSLAQKILGRLGLETISPDTVITATGLADILIGCAVWMRWQPHATTTIQILLVTIYTTALSFAMPDLWLEAFGPLLKNIPFLAAVVTLAIVEVDR